MIIKCKDYRYASDIVYVMVDKIVYFVSVNEGGRWCTRISLAGDKEVLVGDPAGDVYDKIMAVS